MILFVKDNCPACYQIKRFCSEFINIINIDDSPSYIEKHNLMSVPVLLDNDESLIVDLQEIIKKVK